MYECNVVALLVGWIVGWFVSDLGKKNVFNKYKWKVFHHTVYTATGDNFSAVTIHNEQYNHMFYGLVSHNIIHIILAPQ